MQFKDRARLFISSARSIESRRLWVKRFNAEFRTTFDVPQLVLPDLTNVFVNVMPDEEESLALLVSFRPFILEREPIHLADFYNHATTAIKCERSKCILRQSKSRWKKLKDDWPFVLRSAQKRIRAHQGLTLWMYGYVFHSDPEKFELLEGIPLGVRNALKIQALNYVLLTTVEISRVRRIVERAIRKGLLVEAL